MRECDWTIGRTLGLEFEGEGKLSICEAKKGVVDDAEGVFFFKQKTAYEITT